MDYTLNYPGIPANIHRKKSLTSMEYYELPINERTFYSFTAVRTYTPLKPTPEIEEVYNEEIDSLGITLFTK